MWSVSKKTASFSTLTQNHIEALAALNTIPRRSAVLVVSKVSGLMYDQGVVVVVVVIKFMILLGFLVKRQVLTPSTTRRWESRPGAGCGSIQHISNSLSRLVAYKRMHICILRSAHGKPWARFTTAKSSWKRSRQSCSCSSHGNGIYLPQDIEYIRLFSWGRRRGSKAQR